MVTNNVDFLYTRGAAVQRRIHFVPARLSEESTVPAGLDIIWLTPKQVRQAACCAVNDVSAGCCLSCQTPHLGQPTNAGRGSTTFTQSQDILSISTISKLFRSVSLLLSMILYYGAAKGLSRGGADKACWCVAIWSLCLSGSDCAGHSCSAAFNGWYERLCQPQIQTSAPCTGRASQHEMGQRV